MAIAIEELEQLPTRQRLRVTADFDHAAGTLRDPRTARLWRKGPEVQAYNKG